MKKLLISALSCLMIVSMFSSCKKNNGEVEKKYFTIEVSELEATSVNITVTPEDPATTYVYNVVPTAEYKEDSITSRYTKAFFDDIIDFYAYYDMNLYYADLFYCGKDEQTINDLEPETDYTVFAVGIDTVTFKLSTPVVTRTFRTAKWVKKGDKELTFSNVLYTNAVEVEGWWQLYGTSAMNNGTFYFLTVSPSETETVAGTYSMEDMDLDYTYMTHYTVTPTDTISKNISFLEGVFDVKETADGADMEAIVVGSDGYEYTLHVTGILDEDDEDYYEDYAPARRKVAVRRNKAVGVKKVNLATR